MPCYTPPDIEPHEFEGLCHKYTDMLCFITTKFLYKKHKAIFDELPDYIKTWATEHKEWDYNRMVKDAKHLSTPEAKDEK